jgi:hypothetical protein
MIYLGLWVLLLAVSAAQADSFHQQTEGWCSPAIGHTGGNVTINCQGVDPKDLQRLNELLNKKDLDLQEKTREANKWATLYHQAKESQDNKLTRETKALLREGKLEEADTLLRRSAISMAQYHAIQTGMSYPEVVRVLGRPGVEHGSSTHGSGPNIVQYIWQNANGSLVMVVFVNDQVHQKVQRLLR